ncbi:hypothetical protein MP638_002666 [Amoeboaphelidium occidentale]|nr:hypothetical protein MP638_002666 [Amoeboaphelidium occidentale]
MSESFADNTMLVIDSVHADSLLHEGNNYKAATGRKTPDKCSPIPTSSSPVPPFVYNITPYVSNKHRNNNSKILMLDEYDHELDEVDDMFKDHIGVKDINDSAQDPDNDNEFEYDDNEERYDSVVIKNVEDISVGTEWKTNGKDLFSPLDIETMFEQEVVPAVPEENQQAFETETEPQVTEPEEELFQESAAVDHNEPEAPSLRMIKEQVKEQPKSLFRLNYDTATRERLSRIVDELDLVGSCDDNNSQEDDRDLRDEAEEMDVAMKRIKLSESCYEGVLVPKLKDENEERESKAKCPDKTDLDKSFDAEKYNFDYDPVDSADEISVNDQTSIYPLDDTIHTLDKFKLMKINIPPPPPLAPIVNKNLISEAIQTEADESTCVERDEIVLSNCNISSSSMLLKIISTFFTSDRTLDNTFDATRLKSITTLVLDYNNLSDLKFLVNLPTLKRLSVVGNQLSSITETLFHLKPVKKSLEVMDLRYNPFNLSFSNLKRRMDNDEQFVKFVCYKYSVLRSGFVNLTEFDGELIENYKEEYETYKKKYHIIKKWFTRDKAKQEKSNSSKTVTFWVPVEPKKIQRKPGYVKREKKLMEPSKTSQSSAVVKPKPVVAKHKS